MGPSASGRWRAQASCLPHCAERDPDTAPEGWLQKTLAGGGSAVVLAFLCNKALMPIRAPITVALTPVVARCATPTAARSRYSKSLAVSPPPLLAANPFPCNAAPAHLS